MVNYSSYKSLTFISITIWFIGIFPKQVLQKVHLPSSIFYLKYFFLKYFFWISCILSSTVRRTQLRSAVRMANQGYIKENFYVQILNSLPSDTIDYSLHYRQLPFTDFQYLNHLENLNLSCMNWWFKRG